MICPTSRCDSISDRQSQIADSPITNHKSVGNLIRGFSLEEVQSAVGRVEKALGIPSPSRPAVYRRVAEWFIREDYLKHCWRSLGAEDAGVVVPWFAMKPWSN